MLVRASSDRIETTSCSFSNIYIYSEMHNRNSISVRWLFSPHHAHGGSFQYMPCRRNSNNHHTLFCSSLSMYCIWREAMPYDSFQFPILNKLSLVWEFTTYQCCLFVVGQYLLTSFLGYSLNVLCCFQESFFIFQTVSVEVILSVAVICASQAGLLRW